ncbi:MAG: hypothetical protein U0802_22475 [Candidatus Binatia bacterium]
MSELPIHEARARQRRAAERLRFAKKHDAPRRVCLAYPNRYPIAMGNLGFQVVYELFDRASDVVCERAFLPDADETIALGDLRTLEPPPRWRRATCWPCRSRSRPTTSTCRECSSWPACRRVEPTAMRPTRC